MGISPQLAAALRRFSAFGQADRTVILDELGEDLQARLMSLLDQVDRIDPSPSLQAALDTARTGGIPTGMTSRSAKVLADFAQTIGTSSPAQLPAQGFSLTRWLNRLGTAG
jgi:hypothetical protein